MHYVGKSKIGQLTSRLDKWESSMIKKRHKRIALVSKYPMIKKIVFVPFS